MDNWTGGSELQYPCMHQIYQGTSANHHALRRCGAVFFTLVLISFTSHRKILLRHRHVHTIEPATPCYFPTWADLSKSSFSAVKCRSSRTPHFSAPSAALTTSLTRRTRRTCKTGSRRGHKAVQTLASNRRKCPQRRQGLSGTRRSRVGFRGVCKGCHNCTREDSCTP